MPSEISASDRLPPQNLDAERGLLGSFLRENSVLGDVLQIIQTPEVFYYDAHQKIFQAVSDLYNAGKPVDAIILADLLKERGQIEDVGGYGYLGELWNAAPTAANAEFYARIVRDKSISRNLIHAAVVDVARADPVSLVHFDKVLITKAAVEKVKEIFA